MSKPTPDFDVVIVGGGLIGMAAALSLAARHFTVCMLEATEPKIDSTSVHPSFDDRTLVVNPASQQFWQNLGIWQTLLPHATVVKQVHVSQANRFGAVVFTDQELQVPQLAHVIEAKILGHSLWQQVNESPKIKLLAPAELTDHVSEASQVTVNYKRKDQTESITARLLIAADGARSRIRDQAGLTAEIKNYGSTALIANISTELPHQQCAYERLRPSGPLALLPFHQRCGLVWTLPTAVAAEMMAKDDAQFTAALQSDLGYRLGAITRVGKRSSYPLYRVSVAKQYQSRLVLLGNAAHTVSPVSAQGLNLGIRDISRLVEVLVAARDNQQDFGESTVLAYYQQQSQPDQDRILRYTDDLMTWFKIDEPVINSFRSLGLLLVDSQPHLKRYFYRLAGGLN